ncbi:MFS transporter [Sulfurimonas sp.]|uniref:MFS transporter n=1 Tax=Sulfurimonas sp. TaxID=2022749 RepID=UPI0026042CC1|nr:MFS transporter [Sulfurimonas sp.]
MIKISITLFFVVSIIFSTIYTPQAILPTLKEVFDIDITKTNTLLSGMIFTLMIATPFYILASNKWQRKKIMIFSTFFLFLAVSISAVATNFYILLFSRILQGIFIPGITAIMLSYVQDIYPDKHRGLGMGIYMAATSFGAVIGRLLAGWITSLYSWRIAFATFSFLLLIALIAMIYALPSVKKSITKKIINKKMIFNYLFDFKILSILIIPSVVFFSFMAITTFATYYLSKPPFNLSSAQLGNLFLVLLVGVFISPIVGKYSDKIGRVKILFFGIFVLIIGILLSLIQSYIFVVIGIGLVTVGMFSVQSVAPTYLGDLAPNDKTTVAILYQTFFYLGGALGTLLPALVWKNYQYEGVSILSILLLLVGIMPLTFTMKAKSITSSRRGINYPDG